jgi:hypothetical protein
LTYVYYYDIMPWGVIETPRGSYMAKATSSRESSSKAEVSLYSDTLPTDPQNGNIEKRAHRASAARHARKCTVCHHKDREFIDQDYLRWLSPKKIAREYAISHQSVVYRHADATGLRAQRRASLRATADSVVAAVRLYAQINDQGQWTPPVRRHIVEHRYTSAAEAASASASAPKKGGVPASDTFTASSAVPPAQADKNSDPVSTTGRLQPVVTITAGHAVPFSASSEKFPAVPVASISCASNLSISNREHVELEHAPTH